MGDKAEGAKFHRGSNPVDVVRNVQHGMNCNFCHDPHSAKPRIMRDALIDAMTREGKMNVYKDFAARQASLRSRTSASAASTARSPCSTAPTPA